ncbi:hypothetical protein RFI_38353, partial [Reticulomyxa filosa]
AYILVYEQRCYSSSSTSNENKDETNEKGAEHATEQKYDKCVDTWTEEVQSDNPLWKEELDAIERENLKLFRQKNIYDNEFDLFMFNFMSSSISRKSENQEDLKLNELFADVLLLHVLNVVPGLTPDKKEDHKKEWFSLLTDTYSNNLAFVEKFIQHPSFVPWILNLCAKCPQQDTRTYALEYFQHIFKGLSF